MRDLMAKLSELFGFQFEEADEALSEADILYRRTRALAHECGHAVVAWLSPAVLSVQGVTFRRQGDRAAATSIAKNKAHPDYLTENALITLGGLAGEVLIWRRVRSGGFAEDLPIACEALHAFLKKVPLGDLERRWDGRLAESSLDVAAMMRKRPPPDLASAMNLCFRRAKRLLQDNRAGFDRLVVLAERKGDLSADDIASQFGPRLWVPRH